MIELYSDTTEELSRRYRHLFKIPSFTFLSVILAVSNTILFTLVWRLDAVPLQITVAAFASVFVSAFLLSLIIHKIDDSSIVSTRRVFGVFLVASLLWLLVYSGGIGYSILSGNARASDGAFILGGFLAATLELLAINGVFLENTAWSLLLSLLHPIVIFFLVFSSAINPLNHVFPVIVGVSVIVVILFFLFRLKNLETHHHKISSLKLLQAFLKTWTSKNPKELEQHFTTYSHPQETKTVITKFVMPNKEILLILPDIHPGPFYPVGSYNLSETIHRELRMKGSISMVVHGGGGHERNLPSNYFTHQYAEQLKKFVESLSTDSKIHHVRGPLRVILGGATIACIAFDNHVLMTVSNAPYNSDDLDPAIFQEIMNVAGAAGLKISLIDAHNCIGGENGPGLKATREEWLGVFEKLKLMPPYELKLGYSHSSEIDFPPATDDISEGGIGVLIFEDGGRKNVLIVADSNNVIVGLRERIAEVLSENGYQLMELCTSDTHNLAAKSLEGRGYFALGEATPKDTIIDAISKLVALADSRIGPCDSVIASFPMNLPLIGKESLGDFAVVTNQAFAFSKTFAKIAIPLMFVLTIAAILY